MNLALKRWSQAGSNQPISYFLLGKKIYFILNANARSGNVTQIIRSLSKGLPLYSFSVVLSSTLNVVGEITKDVLSEEALFIVLGGDGTFNNTIQQLTYTPATFALIPKGTANDLATSFGIPSDIQEAVRIIGEGRIVEIDTIRVNSNHLVTIGSLGFPALVAESVNEFKKGRPLFKWLHRYVFRSSIYTIFVGFLLVWQRSQALSHRGRVHVDSREFFHGNFTAVFFGKQEVLGKNFKPCPGVKWSDPFFKVAVLEYCGFWPSIRDIFFIARGKPERARHLRQTSAQTFSVHTEAFMSMLGDGEILDRDDEFHGKLMPKALRLVVPKERCR